MEAFFGPVSAKMLGKRVKLDDGVQKLTKLMNDFLFEKFKVFLVKFHFQNFLDEFDNFDRLTKRNLCEIVLLNKDQYLTNRINPGQRLPFSCYRNWVNRKSLAHVVD